MTKKPLTIGTPEYVAWAKKGEQEGAVVERFDSLIDELIEMFDNSELTSGMYARGRRKIKHVFDLDDGCECECD